MSDVCPSRLQVKVTQDLQATAENRVTKVLRERRGLPEPGVPKGRRVQIAPPQHQVRRVSKAGRVTQATRGTRVRLVKLAHLVNPAQTAPLGAVELMDNRYAST